MKSDNTENINVSRELVRMYCEVMNWYNDELKHGSIPMGQAAASREIF